MAYTVLAPSKRVRPVLTLLCAELCGGKVERALPIAATMELVHAASLILDDLPSMDDAPLRRGRSANHREFGEAIAILAAFALLNLAYGTIATRYEPPLAASVTALLADAVGRLSFLRPRRPTFRHRQGDRLLDARADPPGKTVAVRRRRERRCVERRRHARRIVAAGRLCQ